MAYILSYFHFDTLIQKATSLLLRSSSVSSGDDYPDEVILLVMTVILLEPQWMLQTTGN